MTAPFIYVNSPQLLSSMVLVLEKQKKLAVDLECENNLHHFGAYIALIQLSTEKKNYVVDVLALENINPLLKIFRNSEIEKIFHDVSFDFRILSHQFNCVPQNIFDTQLAAALLGKEELGLGSMLQDYFDIRKERRFQMADWTKRPLSRDKLAYAVKDTLYLIPLRNQLGKELRDKERLDWAQEEFKLISNTKWNYKEQGFSEVRGFKSMSSRERAITKRLFLFRRRLAKKVDRPAHFVFNTKQLVEWSKHPPSTLHFWKTVKGVHPVVRSYAKVFFNEVKKGMQEGIQIPRQKFMRFTQKQKNQMEKLEEHRSKLAEKLKIQKHLILNQEQIKGLVTGKSKCLKNWQRKLLKI